MVDNSLACCAAGGVLWLAAIGARGAGRCLDWGLAGKLTLIEVVAGW